MEVLDRLSWKAFYLQCQPDHMKECLHGVQRIAPWLFYSIELLASVTTFLISSGLHIAHVSPTSLFKAQLVEDAKGDYTSSEVISAWKEVKDHMLTLSN